MSQALKNCRRNVATALTAAAAISLFAGPAARAAASPAATSATSATSPACQPLLAAVEKQAKVPSHSYLTATRGAKATSTETIATGGAIYVMIHGKWLHSPRTPQDLEKERASSLGKEAVCTWLRDEAVEGEAAAVYRIQGGPREESTIWISKSRGLPLKTERDTELGVGNGPKVKTHLATRFEYDRVGVPPNVK
jgi:hypothetical protein